MGQKKSPVNHVIIELVRKGNFLIQSESIVAPNEYPRYSDKYRISLFRIEGWCGCGGTRRQKPLNIRVFEFVWAHRV